MNKYHPSGKTINRPKIGITSIPRPFQCGYVNYSMNRYENIKDVWAVGSSWIKKNEIASFIKDK